MNRTLLAVLALLTVATPSASRAVDVTLEVWGGYKRYDALGLRSGVETAANDDDLLKGGFNAVGASAILKVGVLEVGALYEGGLNFETTKSATLAPMVGFGVDVAMVRLELLGELGAQRYYDIGDSSESAWLPYAGIRPGVSLRFDVTGPFRPVIGAWGFARWDLSETTIDVPGPAGGPGTSYDVGGSTFGVVGRVGVEF